MILPCPLCSHYCPSPHLGEELKAARHNHFSKQYLTDNLPSPSNSDFFLKSTLAPVYSYMAFSWDLQTQNLHKTRFFLVPPMNYFKVAKGNFFFPLKASCLSV